MNSEAENRFRICKNCVRVIDSVGEIYFAKELKDPKNLSEIYCSECAHQLASPSFRFHTIQNAASAAATLKFNSGKKSLEELNLEYDKAPAGTLWVCIECSRTAIFRSRLKFLCGPNSLHEDDYQLAYAYSLKFDSNQRIKELSPFNKEHN